MNKTLEETTNINAKKEETTKKYDSDFEHLKVWQDNSDLKYYLSDKHWNCHVNQLLYAYLTSRYKGNEVGVYINLALGIGENAFKIDYNQIYGVMFNEAYCFCHYVLTTPVPETNIGFLENKAESLCPDDAKLAKPIIAYNILVMTGLILCFANDKNDAVVRFLNRLSNYNHTHYFGDEFHHFEDYIKIGLNCVAGIMIDGQIHSPGKLRSGYDYKGQDEYLRKTLPWYRVSAEMFEKRVEKSKLHEVHYNLSELQIIWAVKQLMNEKTDKDGYLMYEQEQFYAIMRVLVKCYGLPITPKTAFGKIMNNLGLENLRIPYKYESVRKVSPPQLATLDVDLWHQYENEADEYTMKQVRIAVRLLSLIEQAKLLAIEELLIEVG